MSKTTMSPAAKARSHVRSAVLAAEAGSHAEVVRRLQRALRGVEADPALAARPRLEKALYGALAAAQEAAREAAREALSPGEPGPAVTEAELLRRWLAEALAEAEATVEALRPGPEFAAEIAGTNGNTLVIQYAETEPGTVTAAICGPRGGILGMVKLAPPQADELETAAHRAQTAFVRAQRVSPP